MTVRLRLFALTAAALLVACGAPPPATRLDRLYRGLDEALPRVDPSVLAGRRILVDPGHGGSFTGTMGRDSLEEKSVNLGVSLYLWGLLREAGAEVWLTRTMDRDFQSAADSSLAADLRVRVQLADSLEADIFVSVHHNAEPGRDPARNTVETYYRAGDPASLDLAFAIHRHLMRNLGIESGEVRQGNYLVLRETSVPAVLGESSYLTNPPVEARLRLSDTQRLEAEAYFLGILDYFSRGLPRVAIVSPADSINRAVPDVVFALTDDGGAGIDPDGMVLTVNAEPVVPTRSRRERTIGARVYPEQVACVLGEDAANGAYEVTLTARNLLGNTSAIQRAHFVIDHPADRAVFYALPQSVGTGAGLLRLRIRLLDARGLPVADGTIARAFTTTDTARVACVALDGAFEFVARLRPGRETTIGAECGGRVFTHRVERSGSGQSPRVVYALDARTGSVVSSAILVRSDTLRVRVAGYVPVETTAFADGDSIRLIPWYDGILHGKRFVLDPEGGRAGAAGVGPLGLSGAYVNLRVAEYVAGFLRDSGAMVSMTRSNEEVRTPEDVARLTNQSRADRYIEIRHRSSRPDSAAVPGTYFFPGSRTGAAMADAVAGAIAERTGRGRLHPAAQVTYPLQQTACPALIVEFPSIGEAAEELRLDSSRYLREQAYGLFTGILSHFGAGPGATIDVTITGPRPGGRLVTVDDTWALLSDEAGRVHFSLLHPGLHSVCVDGVASRVVDSSAGSAAIAIDIPAHE